MKLKKTFPLDYIVSLPKNYAFENDITEDKLKCLNLLKNFVFRRLIQIRLDKKKPKLTDILKLMKKRDLTDPKVRE